MDSIVSIIGTVVGVLGLAYGIYQDRSKSRILKLTRKNAWSTYRSAYQSFLNIWSLHENTKNEIPKELAKAEASIRELHRKCIVHVIDQYPSINELQLEKWHESGKIEDDFALKEFRREIDD